MKITYLKATYTAGGVWIFTGKGDGRWFAAEYSVGADFMGAFYDCSFFQHWDKLMEDSEVCLAHTISGFTHEEALECARAIAKKLPGIKWFPDSVISSLQDWINGQEDKMKDDYKVEMMLVNGRNFPVFTGDVKKVQKSREVSGIIREVEIFCGQQEQEGDYNCNGCHPCKPLECELGRREIAAMIHRML